MSLDKITLEIITNPIDWNGVLQEIGDFDFYHTFEYHLIEVKEDETSTLIVYKKDNIIIALPLLVRKIYHTNYYDATSVYGYAGPISKGITSEFNNKLFIEKVMSFFQENKIISVFSRLNPYINYQQDILKNFGSIVNQGKVVNIDLTLDTTIQRQNYQSRLKTQINKSRRHCIIKKADTPKDLRDFIDIYYENMNRVQAEDHYYFNQEYFDKILTSKNFKAELLLALDKDSGVTIGGSLFVTTKNIVQYHLGATKNEFLDVMPAKLLLDEMRIIATKRGRQFFNLGGGLGGVHNDSLFNFKSSFSKYFKDFELWKLIINQKVYDELVESRKTTSTSFFPKYRFLDKTQL
jgi:lipid II:glycine glycyltransferase (peptidoglycan interpeptide bridge formation enzyme)